MRSLILAFVFIAVFVQGDPLCGPKGVCRAGQQCVAGVGCVRSDVPCQHPETPCLFPKISDCNGGCTFKNCSARKSCLKLVNPADHCEKATCLNGQCVAERLTCAGCNPATGCPTRKATTNGEIHKTYSEESKEVKTNWDDDDHDTPSVNTWNAAVITCVFFILFVSVVVFGALCSLSWYSDRVKY